MTHNEKWIDSVRFGDCRDTLRAAAQEGVSARMCVTSPPYYWARDYGVDGQIGHEATLEGYVKALADTFDLVRNVLADDGTLWLNLGDSYYSGNGQPKGTDPRSPSRNFMREKLRPLDCGGWSIPKKSLLGVPWLVAHELQRRDWTLRAEIIWNRETALAEASVIDRPHRQHETIFLLAKSRHYYFNRAALPEESVWTFPHERGVQGHCAPFPSELARRAILAGSQPGDTVLDPFMGSGTTASVAVEYGRHYVGCELNPAYETLQRGRTMQPGLFCEV
jgi:DNA modification methylase